MKQVPIESGPNTGTKLEDKADHHEQIDDQEYKALYKLPSKDQGLPGEF